MKKTMRIVFSCMLILSLFGCNSSTKNVKIDYGSSAIYTEEDMDTAIDQIKETFKSLEGCELHSLSYSSDDVCLDQENIVWMNDLEHANDDKQVFIAAFALRKKVVELGNLTKNIHGLGG